MVCIPDPNGIDRTDLFTGIAPGAFVLLDEVGLIRDWVDRIHRADLGTLGTANTFLIDPIRDECPAFQGGASSRQMGSVLFPEMTEGGQHRIRSGTAQSA